MMSNQKKGFTLIELLVVVLIIAVLAAVALPQYNKTVEKARMAEAVANVRAIANAHQRYYLEHDEYLGEEDMDKLDIEIPGTVDNTWGAGHRIKTKDFIYSPNTSAGVYLASAQRVAAPGASRADVYRIYIRKEDNPKKIRCAFYSSGSGTAIQKQLCNKLDANGTL